MNGKMHGRRQHGEGIIGMLLAAAIVLIMALLLLRRPISSVDPASRGGGPVDTSIAVSRPEEAIERAQGGRDIMREHRIRQAREQFQAMEGREPASLRELVEKNLLSSADADGK
jgi:hypothetical protein